MLVNIPIFCVSSEAEALFNAKIDKSGGPESCWAWTGGRDGSGYGRVKIGGLSVRAHRVSYFLANNKDPGELMVCHSCDNPVCVNPAHLWLGTNTDNQRDAWAKGRQKARPNPGEENGNAKLTAVDLEKIKVMIANGSTNVAIGRVFGVTHQAISRIRRGRSWGSEPLQPKYASLRR